MEALKGKFMKFDERVVYLPQVLADVALSADVAFELECCPLCGKDVGPCMMEACPWH